jgi:prepilin-type N-terminal cleavage/methylation domain-containing protein
MQKFTRQKKKLQQGFTLVELLLAMGLMGGFMVVLTTIFSSVLVVQNESQATSSVSQDGRFILARLSYDIGRASSITTPAALGGNSTQLVLVIGGVNQTYSLNAGNLQLVNNNGTNILNGSESVISGLSVTRIGNVGDRETIRLVFTVTSEARDNAGTRTQTFTTTVGRR